MNTDQAVGTGGELLKFLVRHPGHGGRHLRAECLLCEQDCSRVALVNLAYVFERCSCGVPEYEHLIERLAHRECMKGAHNAA